MLLFYNLLLSGDNNETNIWMNDQYRLSCSFAYIHFYHSFLLSYKKATCLHNYKIIDEI